MSLLNLNSDVLVNIYHYLSVEDLVKTKLVSKRSKQIVETSLFLTNKIKIAVELHYLKSMEELTRKIAELKIKVVKLNYSCISQQTMVDKAVSTERNYESNRTTTQAIAENLGFKTSLLRVVNLKTQIEENKLINIVKTKNKAADQLSNMEKMLEILEQKNPAATVQYLAYSAFGGKKEFDRLPVLVLNSLDVNQVFTEGALGIKPEQMSHAVMRGVDKSGQLFFAIKKLGNDNQLHVQVFLLKKNSTFWCSLGYKHIPDFTLYVSESIMSEGKHIFVKKGIEELSKLKSLISTLKGIR